MKDYKYSASLNADNASAVILPLIGRGKNVLEIGCSAGTQSQPMVQELGCTVTGVEIDATQAESARAWCKKVLLGDILSMDLISALGDEQFDVITFSDVLEHLSDPAKALERVLPFLAADGCVIASIPNITHSAIVWELAHGRFEYRRHGLLDDTHVRFFSRRTVAALFEQAGMVISRWERFIATPAATEFKVIPTTVKDSAFLDFVRENNADADTYQFVVCAQRAAYQKDFEFPKLIDLERINRDLSQQLESTRKENSVLKSQVDWLDARRLSVRVKRLFRPG